MADPTEYDPSYSFSGWQANNPARPLPAQQVDNELANVATSVNETIDALKDIRRSDGALQNAIVTVESLAADVLIGIPAPTKWATLTEYAVSDLVFDGPKLYICAVEHVSGTFIDDYGAGKWSQIADFTPPVGVIDAVNVAFDPSISGVSATNVQAALDEVWSYSYFLLDTKVSVDDIGALASLDIVGSAQIETGAVGTTALATGAVTASRIADATITNAKLASDVAFRKKYQSSEQSITNFGHIALSHGLGVKPTSVVVELVCKTADGWWSPGDTIPLPTQGAIFYYDGDDTSRYAGVNVHYDASTVYVDIGEGIAILFDEFYQDPITNSRWRLVVRAFA